MDKLSAKSFQAVGDVLLAALPAHRKAPQRPGSISFRISSSVSTDADGLRVGEDAVHDVGSGRQAAPLQPEDDVRFAGHRPDLDLLARARPCAAGHARVDRVDQLVSPLRNALITAAACTPVAVRNASRPTTG